MVALGPNHFGRHSTFSELSTNCTARGRGAASACPACMLCGGQNKTSELTILRYNGAKLGKAKHNVEGEQKPDQTQCHNSLQIGICDRSKNPMPRFFGRADILAFSLCNCLKLSDPQLLAHSRESLSIGLAT
jgi:hypothetical protein